VFTAHTSDGRELLVVRAGNMNPVYFPLTSDGNTTWSGLDKATGLGQGDWTYSLGHGDEVAVLTGISSSRLGKGDLVSTDDLSDAIPRLALVDSDGRVTALLALYEGSWNDNIARWIVRDPDRALGKHMPNITGKQLVATESGPDLTFAAYYDVDQATGKILFEKSPTIDGKTVGMWKRMPDGSWVQVPDMTVIPTMTPPTPEPTSTQVAVKPSQQPSVKPTARPPQATQIATTIAMTETVPIPEAGGCALIPEGERTSRRVMLPDMGYGAFVSLPVTEHIPRAFTAVWGKVEGVDPSLGTITVYFGEKMNLTLTFPVKGVQFEFLDDRDPQRAVLGVGESCLANFQAGDTISVWVLGYIDSIYKHRINNSNDTLPDVQALLQGMPGNMIRIVGDK
jgi:hypothetical protein